MSTKNYSSARIVGKLKTHQYLLSSGVMKKFLPHTTSFNAANLKSMIERYAMLYIKPDVGSQGIGVYKLTRHAGGYTLKSTNRQTQSFTNLKQVYQYMKQKLRRKYIIQQGIPLEKVSGRTYDIRAMIQRKPGGDWTVTGSFAKVGKANMIVNNYYQGGKIVLMNKLFQHLNKSPAQANARLDQMSRVSHKVAQILSSKKPGMYELGIDFGYNEYGHLWILEVNSRHPQIYPLKTIAPDMYVRMLDYAKSIGRLS
jgi:glutathione synthase/RimK-type ligase-like ATP-grasp enzyme